MRPTRLALLTLAFSALAACSAPPTTGGTSTASTNTPYVPDTPTSYGPGDYCAETYVLLQPTTRSNFSLGGSGPHGLLPDRGRVPRRLGPRR